MPAARQRQPLSVAEALALARQFQQRGQLEEAETLCHKILQAVARQPDALHLLGLLAWQQGREQEAAALLGQVVAGTPDNFHAHNNLGNVLQELGRLEEAAAAYRRVIALRPDYAGAYNNLGIVYKEQSKLPEAVAAYRQAIARRPDYADAYYNLGNALLKLGEREEAVAAYRQAIAASAECFHAYRALSVTLFEAGRIEDARGVLEQWLAVYPDYPMAVHMLALCTRGEAPARASDHYVQKLFDWYAPIFDRHIQRLDYHTPALVAQAIAGIYPSAAGRLDILDGGCGTGLCAPLLRPYARTLIGVDLSSRMLDKAGELGVYDELIKAELTAFLKERCAVYDLIACVDTLVYFGELEPIFTAAAGALRSGGHLVFSVESAAPGQTESGILLNPQGRFSHTEAYLRSALDQAGLAILGINPVTLRTEQKKPVAGQVVAACKAALLESA